MEENSMTREEALKAMEEYREAWFLSVAVLLERNCLEVEISSEELDKVKGMTITRIENPDNPGIIGFKGEYKDAGS